MINNIRLINWRNFKDLKLDFKDNNLIIFLGVLKVIEQLIFLL